MGIICLLSYFTVMVVGTPFLVRCSGVNGHVSIEVAHVTNCSDTDAALNLQLNSNACIDQSIGEVVTLRLEEQAEGHGTPGVAGFNSIAYLYSYSYMSTSTSMILPQVISSSDAAITLARTVILQI